MLPSLTSPRLVLAVIQIVMGLLALGSLVLYNSSMDAMHWIMQATSRNESAYTAFNVGGMAITMASTVLELFPLQKALPPPAWGLAATADYPHEIEHLHVALVTALLAEGKRSVAKQAWQAVLDVKSERFNRTPMALFLDATVNADCFSK